MEPQCKFFFVCLFSYLILFTKVGYTFFFSFVEMVMCPLGSCYICAKFHQLIRSRAVTIKSYPLFEGGFVRWLGTMYFSTLPFVCAHFFIFMLRLVRVCARVNTCN